MGSIRQAVNVCQNWNTEALISSSARKHSSLSPGLTNEPNDPAVVGDVTRYQSRLNLARAPLTLKQQGTMHFAPDPPPLLG